MDNHESCLAVARLVCPCRRCSGRETRAWRSRRSKIRRMETGLARAAGVREVRAVIRDTDP